MEVLTYHPTSEWKLSFEELKKISNKNRTILMSGIVLIVKYNALVCLHMKSIHLNRNRKLSHIGWEVYVLNLAGDIIKSFSLSCDDEEASILPTEMNELYNIKRELAECKNALKECKDDHLELKALISSFTEFELLQNTKK